MNDAPRKPDMVDEKLANVLKAIQRTIDAVHEGDIREIRHYALLTRHLIQETIAVKDGRLI